MGSLSNCIAALFLVKCATVAFLHVSLWFVSFFSLSCSHFSKQYRFVEFFSGEANVTWALGNWGLPGLCFDHVYGGRYNDFFEPAGYASLTSKFLDFELFFADWSFVLPTLAVLDSTAVNL